MNFTVPTVNPLMKPLKRPWEYHLLLVVDYSGEDLVQKYLREKKIPFSLSNLQNKHTCVWRMIRVTDPELNPVSGLPKMSYVEKIVRVLPKSLERVHEGNIEKRVDLILSITEQLNADKTMWIDEIAAIEQEDIKKRSVRPTAEMIFGAEWWKYF